MNYSDSIKAILLAAINDLSKTPEKYGCQTRSLIYQKQKLGLKIIC